MQHDRIIAARYLLRALIDSSARPMRPAMPTLVSEREDTSPFTLREGLFHEPKTMPGFARARSRAR